MDQLNHVWNSFANMLPDLLMGIILILVAWIVATLVKKAIQKGLTALNFDRKLESWGAASSVEQGKNTISLISQVFYYLVWVLFLPGIFETFRLTSVSEPIRNMVDSALGFLPNLIAAAVLADVA